MRAVPLSRWLIFFSIAVGGCAADLATKRWMFDWLGMPGHGRGIWWVWPDVFGFQTSLNEGALFGLGQGMVPVFAALSVAAAVAIFCWLFLAGAGSDRFLTLALGCVTAGILGNLYDRLGLPGLRWNRQSAASRGRSGPCRPRLDPGDDRPLALAELQRRRQSLGLRRRAAGLALLHAEAQAAPAGGVMAGRVGRRCHLARPQAAPSSSQRRDNAHVGVDISDTLVIYSRTVSRSSLWHKPHPSSGPNQRGTR